MAALGYVDSLLGGLSADEKVIFHKVFEYVLKELRLGRPGAAEPSENFGGHFYEGTTSSVANREFTIAHRFGRAPSLAIPVLDLQAVNAKIPDLKVTRLADNARLYLSSSQTDIPITVYVEG